jgi:YjbE family integral membrane protein
MLPELGPEFFVALLGVVLADLVLAGDNAVVIALAARNLPPHLRRKAVFWGAFVAIMLRATLTIAAVFLLTQQLPWVQLVGGLLLLWISWRLAVEDASDHEGLTSSTTMAGAIQTILIADVVMSIDNVLAVAAIARNDPWLVVFGLLLSIPIIMGGATLILRVVDRFPIIIWVGAALIAYVGVELTMVDPITRDFAHEVFAAKWQERMFAVGFAVALASTAWYVKGRRRGPGGGEPPLDVDGSEPPIVDSSEPRLMVEGARSDD